MNESAPSEARYHIIERGIRSEELCGESIAARVESGEVTLAALVVPADQNHLRANALVDAQPLVDWVEQPSVSEEIRQRIKACQTGSAWNAPIPIRWFKRRWSPTRAIWNTAEVAWITTAPDDAHVLLLQDGRATRRLTCGSLRFQGFTPDGSAVVRRQWIPMAWRRKFAIAEQDFARLSYLQPLRSLSRSINSAADPERRARYAVPAPTPVTWLIIGACLQINQVPGMVKRCCSKLFMTKRGIKFWFVTHFCFVLGFGADDATGAADHAVPVVVPSVGITCKTPLKPTAASHLPSGLAASP